MPIPTEWEFTHGVVLPLPVILYSEDRGIEVFPLPIFTTTITSTMVITSFMVIPSRLSRLTSRAGYMISRSPRMWLLGVLSALILILVFTSIAGWYKNSKGKAPKGFNSAMEVIILFIRDDVVKPNVGPKYEKYLP